jgi:preprotein translocase subunit SecG
VQFDLSDIIFLAVVLSIAVLLINGSGGGGGHRARVPVLG